MPQINSTPKSSKRPADKGQTTPTTLRTPLDYSEIAGAYGRTENLTTEHPNQHPNSRSLLTNMNSLFRKNFSLLCVLEFPVNFEAHFPRTYESPLLPVGFTRMETSWTRDTTIIPR